VNKYFLNDLNFERKDAGFKARRDALEIISQRKDFVVKFLPLWGGLKSRIITLPSLIKFIMSLGESDALFINFPVARPFWQVLFFAKKIKGFKLIPLIHDIDSLRGGTNHDIYRLAKCDMLISHNKKMSDFMSNHIQRDKIKEVKIFDYLVENMPDVQTNSIQDKRGIIFAGNLTPEKCGFIYDKNEDLFLFGVNYKKTDNPRYIGSFDANHPHKLITDGVFFGLIWDGDSSSTCSGDFGAYLRYNNPHKTSLYLSMGLPVFVWKEAAIADFIVDNRIGYSIANLDEARRIVNEISNDEYDEIKINSENIAKKLKGGFYFNNAIDEVLNVIENN